MVTSIKIRAAASMGTDMGDGDRSDAGIMHGENPLKTNDHRLCGLESSMQQIVAASTTSSTRMQSCEDKLDSLNGWMQIEAKSRASMAALYDREFLRVGQDMYLTKKGIDSFYATSTQQSNVPEEGLDTAQSTSEPINELNNRIADLEVELSDERGKRSQLSKVVVENLHSLAVTLKKRNENSLSLRTSFEDFETIVSKDKERCKTQLDTMKKLTAATAADAESTLGKYDDLQGYVTQLPKHIEDAVSKKVQAELDTITEKQEDVSRYIVMLAERMHALKQPTSVADKGAVEELRATITSFDAEIERTNARISRIETTIGDALNDRRLTDLELQVEDLRSTIDAAGSAVPSTPATDRGPRAEHRSAQVHSPGPGSTPPELMQARTASFPKPKVSGRGYMTEEFLARHRARFNRTTFSHRAYMKDQHEEAEEDK